jgi:hypothetical protein
VPTQSTRLYFYHDNEARECVWAGAASEGPAWRGRLSCGAPAGHASGRSKRPAYCMPSRKPAGTGRLEGVGKGGLPPPPLPPRTDPPPPPLSERTLAAASGPCPRSRAARRPTVQWRPLRRLGAARGGRFGTCGSRVFRQERRPARNSGSTAPPSDAGGSGNGSGGHLEAARGAMVTDGAARQPRALARRNTCPQQTARAVESSALPPIRTDLCRDACPALGMQFSH